MLSHHTTKHVLRSSIAALATPYVGAYPAKPVQNLHEGHPLLYGGGYTALCIYYAGSGEGYGADEVLLPRSYRFGVAAVHPKLAAEIGSDPQEDAEERCSLALSAWLDAYQEDPNLSAAQAQGIPVGDFRVLSTRADDADVYGNPFVSMSGSYLWIEGAEVQVDLL